MADAQDTFSAWLTQAQIAPTRLRPEQLALLQAAFRFRQAQGTDYYSTRVLSHFLLHCDCGLKVAALARLLCPSAPSLQAAVSALWIECRRRLFGLPPLSLRKQ